MYNLFDLKKNSKFNARKCFNCKKFPCLITTFNCLDSITFFKTKTTTITVPLIYYAEGCYQFLSHLNKTNTSIEYQNYSLFLKNNFNILSHDCRKFLPNFHYGCKQRCNSGRWTNPTANMNIDQYYLRRIHFSLFWAFFYPKNF